MKQTKLPLFLFLFTTISVFTSSCQVVGDIFKAGAWFGILGIAVVVVLVLWLVGKARK